MLKAIHHLYYLHTNLIPSKDNFFYFEKLWPFAGPILCGWFVTVFAGGCRWCGGLSLI
jgi:hypothetical protein